MAQEDIDPAHIKCGNKLYKVMYLLWTHQIHVCDYTGTHTDANSPMNDQSLKYI